MSTERDIKTISFGRACRDRLGMYLSADPAEALHLGLREIYVNSLDALTETNQAYGSIKIKINSKNRTISVSDNGPGIPNKFRDDELHSIVAAYTLAHTGSHFDGRAVNSIGTNGVGGSIVNHTAEKFMITSNDGKSNWKAEFKSTENGAELLGLVEQPCDAKMHGVWVQYTPDTRIYGDVWFDKESLTAELSEMMKFYPKYQMYLEWDNESAKKFAYPNGLREADTRIYYESENLIMALDAQGGGIKPYGNRLYLPNGGAFFTHFKTQLTKMVNDLSGLKLTGAQVQAVFGGYLAIFVTNPLFSNQSKTAMSNKEVNVEITSALRQELEKFAETQEWEKIIKRLETEMKAEEAAERARNRVKSAMDDIKKGSRKQVVAADKLKDCIKSGEEAWLAITEGDSAQGALNLGRDIETVATFPIRGKFINCLKNKQEDYLDNEELKQIASILGCGLFNDYNAKNLKYGKVLIAVDADSDGLNIACLLTTFFYVCMPKLIQEGRLYWMKAPLYSKPGSYIFTEEEWKKVRDKKNYKRNKGLGEMTPQEVADSMFGKYKNWVQLKPSNWTIFSKLIKDLMGTDVDIRRDFLFNKVDFENIKFL